MLDHSPTMPSYAYKGRGWAYGHTQGPWSFLQAPVTHILPQTLHTHQVCFVPLYAQLLPICFDNIQLCSQSFSTHTASDVTCWLKVNPNPDVTPPGTSQLEVTLCLHTIRYHLLSASCMLTLVTRTHTLSFGVGTPLSHPHGCHCAL